MKLTLAKALARKYEQVVLYLCLPTMSQTVWTQIRPDKTSKHFETRMVLKKSSIQRVKYGTIIKCEGIIKAVFENPKADQNTLFHKYVTFQLDFTFSQ